MDEIVKDFLIESGENLDRLDQELVQLESDPGSEPLLASIFRTIHTIKGSCGFLGFSHLEKVAHTGENLLSRLRDHQIALSAEVTSGLLAMVDAVRQMLAEIQSTGADGENDYPELLRRLKDLQSTAAAEATPAVPVPQPPPRAVEPGPSEVSSPPAEPAPEIPASANAAEAAPTLHRPTTGKLGGLLVERGSVSGEDLALALAEQEHGDQRRVGEILVALGLCKLEDVLAAQQILDARGREAGVETVRVGVKLLDRLMNLVGELVLARNQLLQFANSSDGATLHAISQRMNLIASELQEEVMKTRMQPIGNVWNKFPRTVRDLALSCGKEVRLEMVGQDTELDRTILEAVKDPLTHLVRNAIDHGIETPELRARAGKPDAGCLTLRAFHEGGQVNLEIADDGAGLNVERIRQKAIDRGLVSRDQAARLADRDVFNFIFLPGFSTAEKITNVSGRGVGMDVVRTNLEKIGGSVDLQSALGRGTTVRIKIPLTLAIVPALVVRSAGERFAIPQMSLTELVRLDSAQAMENVHGAPVYRLRGQLLALVYLRDVLYPRSAGNLLSGNLSSSDRPAGAVASPSHPKAANIAVLQAGSRRFGLVVDDILDTEEIVVKPLGRQLKGISVYAGATIMGDGSVALILDVTGLAERAGLLGAEAESQREEAAASRAAASAQAAGERPLLLAENGASGRLAIPLELVARLEEFPVSVIEHAGEREVMQYRGQIIPLIRLPEIVPSAAKSESAKDAIQVVVYAEGECSAGLIVDQIVDIVSAVPAVEEVNPRPGVAGTCVVAQKVTDLIDVPAVVRIALAQAASASPAEGGSEPANEARS